MSKVFAIELTTTAFRLPVGDTGKVTELDIAKMPSEVLAMALVNGFMGALNNISRGKDEDNKPNSDDVWASMRQKKVDAWLKGEWSQKAGGGERAMTALKEAFIDERKLATGATSAAIEKSIKQTVKDRFGDKEPATFGRFLDAMALILVERDFAGQAVAEGTVTDYRNKLEAKYQKLADDAAKARIKVAKGLDLTGIEI